MRTLPVCGVRAHRVLPLVLTRDTTGPCDTAFASSARRAAERSVRAPDEDTAVAKVREELSQPYGWFGRWETTALDVEVVSVEARDGVNTSAMSDDGPLLLSVADAAKHLGISRNMLYELL